MDEPRKKDWPLRKELARNHKALSWFRRRLQRMGKRLRDFTRGHSGNEGPPHGFGR